jgi:hypothetical protein
VVSSLIPGREPGEILVLAHLCHPKPSAGDNASGAAVAMEMHRVLQRLVERGELARPRLGIRFLLVPEITGTFAYLAREEDAAGRLLFGLNLDMVGQNQTLTGSTLCIESPPAAAASFTPFLLEEAVRRSFVQGTDPSGAGGLTGARIQSTSFSGGSDHMILSDPTVGVPTPMLIQWPDRYYHTSGDTPDKVSAEMLERVVVAGCCYAYTCALADVDQLVDLAALTGRLLRKQAGEEMAGYASSAAGIWIDLEYKVDFMMEAARSSLDSIARLAPDSRKVAGRIAREKSAVVRSIKEEARLLTRPAGEGGRSRRAAERRKMKSLNRHRVRRLHPGPADSMPLMADVGRRRRKSYYTWLEKEPRARALQSHALYWADGRRSTGEIVKKVAATTGHSNADFIRYYFDLLAEAGVVEILSEEA